MFTQNEPLMAIEFTLHAFHINDYFIIVRGCSVLLKQTVMSTSLMTNEIHMKPKCVYIKTELHFFQEMRGRYKKIT